MKKENKILRENAEHNDKVIDKVNWENQELKKENKRLYNTIEELFKNIAFLDEKDAFEKLDKNKELRDWFLVELNASLQRSENIVANLEDRRKLRCYKNAVTSLQVENQELKKELEEKK